MTTQIQRRRGTTAQHSTFTGAVGEVTVDTDKEVLVVHDGAQVGGYPQMRENGSNSALALGSAGTPSLKFAGDTNTGIYSPGADQLALSTNGTGRLFVDASGNVSVGTTTKASNTHFDLYSTSSYAQYIRFRDEVGAPGLIGYNHTDDSLQFYTSGLERLRITSAGLVGVGTSSVSNTLDIRASGANVGVRSTTSGQNQYIFFSNTADSTNGIITHTGSELRLQQQDNVSGSRITFYTKDSERVRIDDQGRLGIGTSTPGVALHIAASTTGNPLLRLTDNSGVGGGGRGSAIDLQGISNDTGNVTTTFARISGLKTNGTQGNTQGVFRVDTDNGSGLQTALTVDSSQRVGIGSNVPPANLTVANNGAEGFEFVPALSSNLNRLQNYNRSGSAYCAYRVDASQHEFHISGSEKARLDTSGRLLVGTSSASLTNKFLLQGDTSSGNNGGYMRLQTGNSIVAGTSLGSIGFGDSANNGALIEAKGDVSWSPFTKGSRLEFSVTQDGSASPTERLRISQDGAIGLYSSSTYGCLYSGVSSGAGTSVPTFVGRHSSTNTVNGTETFKVWSNGNVVNTNNSYAGISDIKLKENIVDASSQWSDIKALQVRNYNFKEGQTHTQIGLIAQEVELVSPGLVSESPDRDADGNDLGTVTKSVNYSVLYMKAVKALQEAMERIETLEAKVAALESA